MPIICSVAEFILCCFHLVVINAKKTGLNSNPSTQIIKTEKYITSIFELYNRITDKKAIGDARNVCSNYKIVLNILPI